MISETFDPPCDMIISATRYHVEVIDHEVVFTEHVFKRQIIFSRVFENSDPRGLWQVRTQDYNGNDLPTYLCDATEMGALVREEYGDDFHIKKPL